MNTLAATYPDGAQLEFDIPENWSELTREQFAAVAPYVHQGDVLSLLTRFAYIILGKKLFKKIQSEENMDEMVHAFMFLCAVPVLEKSHYKGFRIFGKRFCGIDDRLLDISIKDFGLCEQTVEHVDSDKLSAKIFFSTVYNRGIFNFIPLRKKKKAALRLNYKAVSAILPSMYPALPTSEVGSAPDYHAMIVNLSTSAAEIKTTEKANLHDVLKFLEERTKQEEKEKSKSKK